MQVGKHISPTLSVHTYKKIIFYRIRTEPRNKLVGSSSILCNYVKIMITQLLRDIRRDRH